MGVVVGDQRRVLADEGIDHGGIATTRAHVAHRHHLVDRHGGGLDEAGFGGGRRHIGQEHLVAQRLEHGPGVGGEGRDVDGAVHRVQAIGVRAGVPAGDPHLAGDSANIIAVQQGDQVVDRRLVGLRASGRAAIVQRVPQHHGAGDVHEHLLLILAQGGVGQRIPDQVDVAAGDLLDVEVGAGLGIGIDRRRVGFATFLSGLLVIAVDRLGQADAGAVGVDVQRTSHAVDHLVGHLARRAVEVADVLGQVLQPFELGCDQRVDRGQRGLEKEAHGVVAHLLQHGLELGLVDEREAAEVGVNAAAAALDRRQRQVPELVVADRCADLQLAAGVQVHRLAAVGARRRDIAQYAERIEHFLHLGVHVAGQGWRGSQRREGQRAGAGQCNGVRAENRAGAAWPP